MGGLGNVSAKMKDDCSRPLCPARVAREFHWYVVGDDDGSRSDLASFRLEMTVGLYGTANLPQHKYCPLVELLSYW